MACLGLNSVTLPRRHTLLLQRLLDDGNARSIGWTSLPLFRPAQPPVEGAAGAFEPFGAFLRLPLYKPPVGAKGMGLAALASQPCVSGPSPLEGAAAGAGAFLDVRLLTHAQYSAVQAFVAEGVAAAESGDAHAGDPFVAALPSLAVAASSPAGDALAASLGITDAADSVPSAAIVGLLLPSLDAAARYQLPELPGDARFANRWMKGAVQRPDALGRAVPMSMSVPMGTIGAGRRNSMGSKSLRGALAPPPPPPPPPLLETVGIEVTQVGGTRDVTDECNLPSFMPRRHRSR